MYHCYPRTVHQSISAMISKRQRGGEMKDIYDLGASITVSAFPIAHFAPAFRGHQNLPDPCLRSTPILISGVSCSFKSSLRICFLTFKLLGAMRPLSLKRLGIGIVGVFGSFGLESFSLELVNIFFALGPGNLAKS